MSTQVGAIEAVLRIKDENASATLAKMSTGIKGLVGQIAGVVSFGAALKLATDALRAQGEQEAAINKLNLALANQGKLVGTASKDLIAYSGAMQDVSIFSDDAVLGIEAQFVAMGKNVEETKRLTKATIDFASFTGKDLPDAARIMSLAMEGNVRGLKQYGIHVDESKSKSQQFEDVLAQMEGKFKGAGKAATESFGGQMKVLQNQVGEAQEAFGKFLGELLGGSKPFGMAIDLVKKLTEWIGVNFVQSLGIARATLLGWMADLASTRLGGFAIKKMLGLDDAGLVELQKSLRAGGTEFIQTANKAAEAAGKTLEFANNTRAAAGAVNELTDAQKKANKEFAEQSAALDRVHAGFLNVSGQWERIGSQFSRPAGMAGLGMIDVPLLSENPLGRQIGSMLNRAPDFVKTGTSLGTSFGRGFETSLKNLPAVIMRAIEGGGDVGRAIGASIGRDLTTELGKRLGEQIGGKLGAALGSAIPVIGTALGGLLGSLGGKLFGGLFGGEGKKVNRMRDEFISAAGGIDVLRQRAAEAGITLDRLLSARKVKDFEAAVKDLTGAFDLQKEANERLQAAIDKYGFSIEELGPKWRQQEMDRLAADLLGDYQLLIASGIENETVLTRMAGAFSELALKARATGIALPEALRAPMMKLLEMGLLTDSAGNKLEDLSGVDFSGTLTESMQRAVDALDRLVAAIERLAGITPPTVTIPVQWGNPGPLPGGGNPFNPFEPPQEPAAFGWSGFVSGPATGYPAPFTMHGTERVSITPAGRGGRDDGASNGAVVDRLDRLERALLYVLPKSIRDAQQMGSA